MSTTPENRARTGLRPLMRCIGTAAMANKGLVVSILLLGVLQAFLSKAPVLLLLPFGDVLASTMGTSGGGPDHAVVAHIPAEVKHDWFTTWFEGHAVTACQALGLDFSGSYSPAKARALELCVACGLAAGVLGLLGAFAIYGTLLLTRYFATKIVVDLRNQIGGHLLRLPLRFFGRRRMGQLLSNITNDTTVLSRSFQLACDHVVNDPLLVLGNMALIALAMPEAIWVMLLMVPVMALPLVRMGRKVHNSSRSSLAAMGDATESMNQMLSGIKTVKAFQLERQRLGEFEDNNRSYLRRTTRMLKAKALSQAMVFAAYQAGVALMVIGLGWLMVNSDYGVGPLLTVTVTLSTTYTHVKRLSRAYNTLMESNGALERIDELLAEKPDVAALDTGRVLEEIRGDVAFESVRFAYDRDRVLDDVSFRVSAGQTVALVGPSGAGKSTALDLLARFHDPQSGRILIDGHDLRGLNANAYRRRLAIVGQQPFLFNVSIGENIRYGRPGASDAEVIEAAKAAQIHDFVVALPSGYETLAGERGCNLSGGQMQRITIARAVLRDPAILILDEATSALDSENEEAVQAALQNLMTGRTSFVIAHRLSTITRADLILVLDQGKLIEFGTHDELLEKDGLYLRLSQLQQLV